MSRGIRFLLEMVETVGPFLFKTLMVTLRFRLVDLYKERKVHREHGPVIWAFWHNVQAGVGFVARNRGVRVLVSAHYDGEFVARLTKGMGYYPVRGSTRRGGTQALLELAGTRTTRDFAITPDGPRGPCEHVQAGIIMLARTTGRPIVPIGVAMEPSVRLHGWDRFVVPYPCARAAGVIGDPMLVPADADAAEREACRSRLEQTLKELTHRAEEVCRRRPPGANRHLGNMSCRHA